MAHQWMCLIIYSVIFETFGYDTTSFKTLPSWEMLFALQELDNIFFFHDTTHTKILDRSHHFKESIDTFEIINIYGYPKQIQRLTR